MNRITLSFGLLLFASAIIVASTFALPFEGVFKLDIIHFNDFHARFEETSVATPTCRFNNNSCLGGFPRLYHEVSALLRQKPEAVVLNAGDSFQGTYWYTLLKWNVTQRFMNLLPLDAHALGNHEFDDGPAGLAPYLASLKAPVLAANMDCSGEPALRGLYRASTVLRRGGRRIGVIGLITPDTKQLSSPGNVTFTDPGAATKREAAALTEQGVDIIILLSHCGLEVDKQLARDHGEYIDIIVGGHSHSLLWNGRSPSNETVEGPYPVFVQPTADQKHNVVIVQASAFTKYMGNLTVYFDVRGDYVKWEGGPIFLDRSIEEDKDMLAQLAPYAKLVHAAEMVVVGETTNTLNYEDCVFGECALGDLLVDSSNSHAKATVKSSYEYLSFIQRGNIKSSLPKGNITEGNLFELLPYLDRVLTFELEGRFVREALERSVSQAWALNPFKGPWVLQVSGIRVVYNATLPEGRRLLSATVGASSLQDEELYQVTAPAYLANGGDGFTMFTNKRNVQGIGRDKQILEDYIRLHSPLQTTPDGRIKIFSQ